MKINLPSQLGVRSLILATSAAILTWLIVSTSLAAYLANIAPGSALWLNPRQPEALANLADRMLSPEQRTKPADSRDALEKEGRSPAGSASEAGNVQALAQAFSAIDSDQNIDLARVRHWANAALTDEPLNSRALRVLGQVASISKDDVSAWNFMQGATRLSLHETIAVYWLMQKSYEAKDYKTVVYYADVLLRTTPQLTDYVVPLVAQTTGDKEANDLLKSILANNPPWRGRFLASLPASVSDPRAPLDILLALRTTAAPPTSADISPYVTRLISHKLYDLAYYTWLQFIAPEQLRDVALLFNGNFTSTPTGLPFDWVITPGSGVTIDIVPRPDKPDANALAIDFEYGRVEYHSVSELVMLPPGKYQFGAKYKGELGGPRGLKWRIVCAGESATRIGESAMISGLASTWRSVDFTFTVPNTDCRAQYVQLDLDARSASEQFVSGSMRFAELQISRSPSSTSDNAKP